jgi:hypothetical protein
MSTRFPLVPLSSSVKQTLLFANLSLALTPNNVIDRFYWVPAITYHARFVQALVSFHRLFSLFPFSFQSLYVPLLILLLSIVGRPLVATGCLPLYLYKT